MNPRLIEIKSNYNMDKLIETILIINAIIGLIIGFLWIFIILPNNSQQDSSQEYNQPILDTQKPIFFFSNNSLDTYCSYNQDTDNLIVINGTEVYRRF